MRAFPSASAAVATLSDLVVRAIGHPSGPASPPYAAIMDSRPAWLPRHPFVPVGRTARPGEVISMVPVAELRAARSSLESRGCSSSRRGSSVTGGVGASALGHSTTVATTTAQRRSGVRPRPPTHPLDAPADDPLEGRLLLRVGRRARRPGVHGPTALLVLHRLVALQLHLPRRPGPRAGAPLQPGCVRQRRRTGDGPHDRLVLPGPAGPAGAGQDAPTGDMSPAALCV